MLTSNIGNVWMFPIAGIHWFPSTSVQSENLSAVNVYKATNEQTLSPGEDRATQSGAKGKYAQNSLCTGFVNKNLSNQYVIKLHHHATTIYYFVNMNADSGFTDV